MKSLKSYIQEKLIIKKSTAKKNNISYKYFPQTKEELQDIIKQRIKQEGNDVDLNDIDVSNITDMSDFGFEIDFEKENQRISENKEIDTNEFNDEEFDLECPRCGFRWNNE